MVVCKAGSSPCPRLPLVVVKHVQKKSLFPAVHTAPSPSIGRMWCHGTSGPQPPQQPMQGRFLWLFVQKGRKSFSIGQALCMMSGSCLLKHLTILVNLPHQQRRSMMQAQVLPSSFCARLLAHTTLHVQLMMLAAKVTRRSEYMCPTQARQ